MAVIAYKIVRATNASGLTAEVTAALADDWQPSGGIFHDEHGGALMQAMVKESAPDEPVE